MNEKYIRNQIRKILNEINEQKEEKKKPKSGYEVMKRPVKGIGRGRFSSAIVSAKVLILISSPEPIFIMLSGFP